MQRVIAAALRAAIAMTITVALPRDASAAFNSLIGEDRIWVSAGITQGLRDHAKLGGQGGFGLTHYYTDRWGVGLEFTYGTANSPRDDVTGVVRVHQSVECVFKRFAERRPFIVASHGLNHWVESQPSTILPNLRSAGDGYGISVGAGVHSNPAFDAFATLLAEYHHTFGVDAARPIVSVTLAIGW